MSWIFPPYYIPPNWPAYEDRAPTWKSSPAPQPWECPRCHKMHGPLSLACDCKPNDGGSDGG